MTDRHLHTQTHRYNRDRERESRRQTLRHAKVFLSPQSFKTSFQCPSMLFISINIDTHPNKNKKILQEYADKINDQNTRGRGGTRKTYYQTRHAWSFSLELFSRI